MDVSRDCPIFFKYPLLSQERVKLRTLNLAATFSGSIQTKNCLKIWEERERGRIQGCRNFFQYPLLSQELVKLATNIKFCMGTFL